MFVIFYHEGIAGGHSSTVAYSAKLCRDKNGTNTVKEPKATGSTKKPWTMFMQFMQHSWQYLMINACLMEK